MNTKHDKIQSLLLWVWFIVGTVMYITLSLKVLELVEELNDISLLVHYLFKQLGLFSGI